MYRFTAADFHLPKAEMSSSGIPWSAAQVAAPRQKEWPVKCPSRPAAHESWEIKSSRYVLVKGCLSLRWNNGQCGWAEGLAPRYISISLTGQ